MLIWSSICPGGCVFALILTKKNLKACTLEKIIWLSILIVWKKILCQQHFLGFFFFWCRNCTWIRKNCPAKWEEKIWPKHKTFRNNEWFLPYLQFLEITPNSISSIIHRFDVWRFTASYCVLVEDLEILKCYEVKLEVT